MLRWSATPRRRAAQAEQVASTLRGKAIAEVAAKDREVSRSRGLARGAQMADYAFSLIYGLQAIRLALPIIVALVFYALPHGAIRAGLRVMANRRTTI